MPNESNPPKNINILLDVWQMSHITNKYIKSYPEYNEKKSYMRKLFSTQILLNQVKRRMQVRETCWEDRWVSSPGWGAMSRSKHYLRGHLTFRQTARLVVGIPTLGESRDFHVDIFNESCKLFINKSYSCSKLLITKVCLSSQHV